MFPINKLFPWGPAGLVLFIAAALFWRSASFDKLEYDDPKHIFENSDILRPSLDNVAKYWREPYFGMYIPTVYTTWSVVSAVSGGTLTPRAYHQLNIFLHACNSFFVFVWLWILLRAGASSRVPSDAWRGWAAAAGALVFAAHPLQVESVAWISAAKDLLLTLFSLSAGLCYWVAIRSSSLRHQTSWSVGGLVLFVLALTSKPTAVVLPLWLVLVHRFIARGSWSEIGRFVSPWLLTMLPFVWITKQQQPDSTITFHAPMWARPLVALDSLSFYLRKFLLPFELVCDYTRTPSKTISEGWIYYSWLLPVSAFAVAFWKRKQWPWVLVGMCIFAAGVLPVSGIVSFQFQKFSTVADRYAYFPLFGLAIVIAGFVDRIRSEAGRWAVAAPLTVLAILSSFQINVWADTETLLTHSLRYEPDSVIGHTNLGFHLHMGQRYDRSAYHFEQALKLSGDDPTLRLNYGAALGGIGKYEEGIRQLELAIAHDPNNAGAWYNLGTIHLKVGNADGAVSALQRAHDLKPTVAVIRRSLEVAQEMRKTIRQPTPR